MNVASGSTAVTGLHPSPSPLEIVKQRAGPPPSSGTKQQNDHEVVSWLRAEIQKRPGYADFSVKFKNHRLQNPDVVKYWTFAADFLMEYSCRNYQHLASLSSFIFVAFIDFKSDRRLQESIFARRSMLVKPG